jgi:hypothetical protein
MRIRIPSTRFRGFCFDVRLNRRRFWYFYRLLERATAIQMMSDSPLVVSDPPYPPRRIETYRRFTRVEASGCHLSEHAPAVAAALVLQ